MSKERIDWNTFKIENITETTYKFGDKTIKLPFRLASFVLFNICQSFVNKEVTKITKEDLINAIRATDLYPYLNSDNVDFKEYSDDIEIQNKELKETIQTLQQDNARMREGLEKIVKCKQNYKCLENGKGCFDFTYRVDCPSYLATEALQQKGEDVGN